MQDGRDGVLKYNIAKQGIYRIRELSIFKGKNSKALKRRKYKGFCVFLLYEIVVVLLKYGENKAKRAKNSIFNSLKALQYKAFREILS